MNAANNGSDSQAAGAPQRQAATIADAIDTWALVSYSAGEYDAEAHARMAAAVLFGSVPIAGEIDSATGQITWYSEPQPLSQAE